jgi:predicted ester cyclase
VGGFRSAFPDVHATMEDEIIEGDKAVVRWTLIGTQKGSFGDLAPTGEPLKISGIDIFRIADGKIEELWVAQP